MSAIAQILDGLPDLEAQVLSDLTPSVVRREVGRQGLSAQQTLRCMVLYLRPRADFEQLEFHLADSPTYRAFCLLGIGDAPPKRACLQKNISAIGPQTLKALHQIVVAQAVKTGVELGHAVRIDTTPVAAPVRAPLDSTLLGDAVRVLLRLLRRAQKMVPMAIPNHGRRVRRRVGALRQEKLDDEERVALYFDLLQDTKRYVEAALLAAEFLDGVSGEKAARLGTSLRAQAENALCICDQAERRVLDGHAVSATDKRASMFETHADILHGNPADATLAQHTVEQTRDNTGRTPRRWIWALRPRPTQKPSNSWASSGWRFRQVEASTPRQLAAAVGCSSASTDFARGSRD